MGSSFGEDIILHLVTDCNRPRKYSVVAITFLDVQVLDAIALKNILESGVYPAAISGSESPCAKCYFRLFSSMN